MQNTHDLLVGTLSIGIPSILFYFFFIASDTDTENKKKITQNE